LQTNWGTQNFPIFRNNLKSFAYIWTVVVGGACLRSIKTLVVSIKGFFLLLLENVIVLSGISAKSSFPQPICHFTLPQPQCTWPVTGKSSTKLLIWNQISPLVMYLESATSSERN
jgi:hypothetical protein